MGNGVSGVGKSPSNVAASMPEEVSRWKAQQKVIEARLSAIDSRRTEIMGTWANARTPEQKKELADLRQERQKLLAEQGGGLTPARDEFKDVTWQYPNSGFSRIQLGTDGSLNVDAVTGSANEAAAKAIKLATASNLPVNLTMIDSTVVAEKGSSVADVLAQMKK